MQELSSWFTLSEAGLGIDSGKGLKTPSALIQKQSGQKMTW